MPKCLKNKPLGILMSDKLLNLARNTYGHLRLTDEEGTVHDNVVPVPILAKVSHWSTVTVAN